MLHDGEKVTHIKRYTRSYPVALRILLEIGPAPDFDGPVCIDCGRHFHLERDHLDPMGNGGVTALDNLNWRCPHCHKTKTEADRKAGRINGKNRSRPPDSAEQPTLTGRGPP